VRRAIIFTITIVFAIALLARAATYTVRFTEAAVLTTFGKAGENSVQLDPGLKFKWPDPIQSVTKYDTRSRFLQTPSVTQQTLDNSQLVLEAYCTWRVSDPLLFFQKFSNEGDRTSAHYKGAEKILHGNLRSAMGEVSAFRMGQLFTPIAEASQMEELERRIRKAMEDKGADGRSIADYGIAISSVGISRIILPESTTQAVMQSMKEDRDRLVKELQNRAEAQRQAIVTAAESHADKIKAFAEAYAAEIRQLGDMEAATYVAQMNEAPELAVFLKNIDFIRTATAKRITWIVSGAVPGFELMFPQNSRLTGPGRIPGVSLLMGDDPSQHIAHPEAGEPQQDESTRIAAQRGQPAPAPANSSGDRQ
jgi:modulator of FtsH protease HflC